MRLYTLFFVLISCYCLNFTGGCGSENCDRRVAPLLTLNVTEVRPVNAIGDTIWFRSRFGAAQPETCGGTNFVISEIGGVVTTNVLRMDTSKPTSPERP